MSASLDSLVHETGHLKFEGNNGTPILGHYFNQRHQVYHVLFFEGDAMCMLQADKYRRHQV